MPLPKSKYQGPMRGEARVPPKLELCRGCKQFVAIGTATCPHCGAGVQALAADYAEKMRAVYRAAYEVQRRLRRLGVEIE